MSGVDLIGDSASATAFAHINRQWRDGLQRRGWSVGPADAGVRLHHDFAAEFIEVALPPGTPRLAVRPWDFGPYPRAWVERLATHWEGLVVHSQWTRSLALRGGVPAERVHLVPLGFEAGVFHPTHPPSERPFRFLFVGASIHRKGYDTLLGAWQSAFGADEPVCLVVKDHTADRFYQGIQQGAAGARVEYLDAYLDAAALAELYRSCHVGVFPYRAEGFALPVLEAMACGLPCLVPRFGPCLDYCTDDSAWWLQVRRLSLPVGARFSINTLGYELPVEEVDYCEVRPGDLAAAMRAVYEAGAAAAARRGEVAARHAHAGWTWEHSLEHLVDVLKVKQSGCMA